MGGIFFAILKSARPRQWLKNLALFTTALITGHVFEPNVLYASFIGFLSFCLLSSSNYIFNDVMDEKRDKKHPFKRFRPVASGSLPVPFAIAASIVLVISGLALSRTLGTSFFFLSIVFIFLEYDS